MDEIDRNILALLASDARMSVATMARRIKLARSTVQARLERLESTGVIAGYTLKLGDAITRGRIRATVLLVIEPRAQAAIMARLNALPAIEVAHTTSGRFDLLLEVSTDNTAALDAVLDKVGQIPGIKSSESLIHLKTKIDRSV
ncbi:Lrp/AsnC family transcriptional regulator [Actibacterium sp. XHP0104]|uniref:Lrp/AsnC family transcriptional regulator n=1 Tax=Actibacterium sp. XHP0104 TaxID=2984335 RepID=UPI0021E6F94F|nr:Lrp/AsnC family transcriptional regulator [Actibacterium sp. XHP0104]MCV2881290.1 Lrp/AsnC family transcriptional regulator [Actibacterium sp. XHP0104]